MKFGKTMERTVKEDWKVYSVNYKLLKKKLPSRGEGEESSISNSMSMSNSMSLSNSVSFANNNNTVVITKSNSTTTSNYNLQNLNTEDELKASYYPSFWEIYTQCLLVIETFHHQKMNWAVDRFKHCESDVERHRLEAVVVKPHPQQQQPASQQEGVARSSSKGGRNCLSLKDVRGSLDTFANDLDTLLEFYNLNFTAISKILKKYDKRTSSNVRSIMLEEVKGTHPFLLDGGMVVKGYKERIEDIQNQVRRLEIVKGGGGGGANDKRASGNEKSRGGRRFLAMLEKARVILDGVENDSPFFSKHEQRNNPTFQGTEIVRGAILGEGEFGTVREIRSFQHVKEECPICFLHRQSSRQIPMLTPIRNTRNTNDDIHNTMIGTRSVMTGGIPSPTGECTSEIAPAVTPTEQPIRSRPPTHSSISEVYTVSNDTQTLPVPSVPLLASTNNNTSTTSSKIITPIKNFSLPDEESIEDYSDLDEDSFQSDHEEEDAEEVAKRGFMAHHCLKDGNARYAIKHVKASLVGAMRVESAIDLAIEAKILSVISHSNIVRLRGTGGSSPGHPDYFLILDRLYGTLGDKYKHWKGIKQDCKGFLGWKRRNCPELKSLWDERLMVMFDIAGGMRYLHEHEMMYRDLKPENIGFDVSGNVKIFDFGLAKELKPKHRIRTDTYHASGRTGTRRYMAPEVTLCKPYGKSADVYSFSILFWETMALETPYPYDCHEKHAKHVVQGQKRPPVSSSWPTLIRALLKDAWAHDPKTRPSFGTVCQLISGEVGNVKKVDESDQTSRLLHLTSPTHFGHT